MGNSYDSLSLTFLTNKEHIPLRKTAIIDRRVVPGQQSIFDYSRTDYSLRPETFGRMDKSLFSRDYDVFLRRLREARRDAGLTQVELAERLDQTQSFVSKCERGERRLDIVEVRAFCIALGVSFRAFVAEFDQELATSD